MKKYLFIIALSIFSFSVQAQKNVSSQNYTTAAGVKFYPGSFTIKHFIQDNAALEGLAYFYNRGMRVTGLYEFHFDINGAPGLKWYVGPGAHVGFYTGKKNGYDAFTRVGIDGVLGLDYKFAGAPINISLDWQPSVDFGSKYGNGFNGNWGGFAIRYVF